MKYRIKKVVLPDDEIISLGEYMKKERQGTFLEVRAVIAVDRESGKEYFKQASASRRRVVREGGRRETFGFRIKEEGGVRIVPVPRQNAMLLIPRWVLLSIIAASLLGWVFLCSGCGGSLATSYRKDGTLSYQKSFDSIKYDVAATKGLHKIIELKSMRIYIVGDPEEINGCTQFSGVVGCSSLNNEIWILGKIVDGKIVINQSILGHELNHLIENKDKDFINPDRLEDFGL